MANATASVDLTSENGAFSSSTQEEEEPEEEELHLLGTVSGATHRNCRVVGIRHYRGVAHPGEYVTLSREPQNPYDANAVRVDNIEGAKVGHIKRHLAVALSPFMLAHPEIRVDATIPSHGTQWELPVKLELYGPDPSQSLAVQQTFDQFKQFQPPKPKQRPSYSAQAALPAPPVVHVQTRRIDWKEQQKHLDDMFEKQCKEQLANLPVVAVPAQLVTELLEHQVQGLRWLYHRECGQSSNPFYKQITEQGRPVWFCEVTNSSTTTRPATVKGGILADDMGLGKTIQTIALILANPPEGRDYSQKRAAAAAATTEEVPAKKPNKTAVKKQKLPLLQNVLLDSGMSVPNKKDQVVNAVLNGLDTGAISVPQYYAGLSPRSAGLTGLTTLIVCPVSVMGNWQEQIEAHVEPGTLRVAYYHGADRKEILGGLSEIDVLVTSYGTLSHDFKNDKKKGDENLLEPAAKRFKGNSIFGLVFHRIILDEAHGIRNAKTKTFLACAALQAERRLCLSGTPLQNKPEDIHSLLHFLQLPPLGNKDVFRRSISQPIKGGDEVGLSRLRCAMAFVALRRNKGQVNFDLPEKQVELRAVNFPDNSKHKGVHDSIYDSAKLAFQATMQGGGLGALAHHASVFEILTRLRQACCSGALVPVERLKRAEDVLATIKKKDQLSAEEGKQLLEKLKGALVASQDDDDDAPPECAICFDQLNESLAVVLRGCGHVFCRTCLSRVAQDFSSNCPFCRHPFKQDDMVKWSVAAEATKAEGKSEEVALSQQMDDLGPAPKMVALLAAVSEMKDGEKGVIFSQFTKFLDEIGTFLKTNGHDFCRVDGKKTATQRIEAIKTFSSEDGGPKFMLCSLHAAGVGLNLTRANHIYMMDTWWNKAVEVQAFDRVHRIGQTKPVRVVRFVAADSIESRMVDLQEAKAALGKGAFENLNAEDKKKARMNDLKRLLEL